jgi:hypothetical protein
MGNLRIQDLSIGDWVTYNEEYYQILNVGAMCYVVGKGLEFRHYCTLTKDMDIQDGIDINEISPIPITPEILEKNGFAANFKRYYTCELCNVRVDVDRLAEHYEITTFRILSQGGLIVKMICPITNIHQLQHALRLAGVDKQITL